MGLLLTADFLSPIYISLKVAITATIISFVIGIVLVFIMTHTSFPGKSIVETLIMLPMVLPPTVVGFILLYLFGRHGIAGQWLHLLFNINLLFTVNAAIIASTIVAVPLMYQSLKIGIDNVDHDVIDAAKVDGANHVVIFRSIVIPLSKNALLTGILFAFARAIGEFGATLIFAGNIPGVTQTLPTAIYIALENNERVIAGLWVIIMMVLSFILMFVIQTLRNNTK